MCICCKGNLWFANPYHANLDPHEANVLVRAHPYRGSRHPQVVLLDHGLYRQLEEGFRVDYCRLWQGIVLGGFMRVFSLVY